MAGKWALKAQTGDESVAGTAVAASAIWMGQGPMPSDDRVVVKPMHQDGLAVKSEQSYTASLGASWPMAATEATYEQLDYVLSSALEDQITGTADGSGSSGYVRTYDAHGANNTALNDIVTRTWEFGDNQQAEEMEYSFVTDFTLAQVMGEAMKVSANWVGRQLTKTTFTGSISRPTVEYIDTPLSLFIDDSGGTIGSTQISNTIYSMSLAVTTGWVFDPPRDGAKYPSVHRYNEFAGKLSLTFKHNSSIVSEKDDWRANTPRLIRLQSTGSAYGTAGSGTLFSGVKGIRIDMAGSYESFEPLSEQDGDTIYSAVFDIRYVTADALAMQIKLANEVSATP